MATRLKDLRNAAGLTLDEVVNRLLSIVPDAPKTRVGLHHIEQRGTTRLHILRGLATVYGLDLDVVETAAKKVNNTVQIT